MYELSLTSLTEEEMCWLLQALPLVSKPSIHSSSTVGLLLHVSTYMILLSYW